MYVDKSKFLQDVEELRATRAIVKDKEVVENTGFSKTVVSDYLTGKKVPSKNFLQKFYDYYGNQLNRTNVLKEPNAKYNEAVHVNLSEFKTLNTKIVSQYAYAGYLHGYNDEHYMGTLPDFPWMVDKEYKGTYLTFQVKGDSMDDGGSDSYKEGDMLLCREIAKDLWQQNKLHIKKWDFVIVHKTEGILIKRITAHDVAQGIITIHSINDFYTDQQIKLNDVAQIFNVVQSLRKR